MDGDLLCHEFIEFFCIKKNVFDTYNVLGWFNIVAHNNLQLAISIEPHISIIYSDAVPENRNKVVTMCDNVSKCFLLFNALHYLRSEFSPAMKIIFSAFETIFD